MSDTSEEEDLSKFKDVVDTTFMKLINESRGNNVKESDLVGKKKSEKHIETSTHYNDIRVPEEMQKKIGAKISAIIEKNVEYVTKDNNINNPVVAINTISTPISSEFNCLHNQDRKRKIKGGIKLFTDSENFLSCDESKDTYTKLHNMNSKKIKNHRRQIDSDRNVCDEDKVKQVAVTGEYIMSKEEIKTWKSRRKEKLFKYKSNGKKVFTAVE